MRKKYTPPEDDSEDNVLREPAPQYVPECEMEMDEDSYPQPPLTQEELDNALTTDQLIERVDKHINTLLKAQLQKDIENEQNSSIIERMQAYYRRLKTAPCQFSTEELIEEVRRSVEDAGAGGGKTMDEMRKKHPLQ